MILENRGEIHEMVGRRGVVIDTGKLNDHAIDLQLRQEHRERRRQRGKQEEQISWSKWLRNGKERIWVGREVEEDK